MRRDYGRFCFLLGVIAAQQWNPSLAPHRDGQIFEELFGAELVDLAVASTKKGTG